MVTFLYHKQIQRIQAKNQSILLIFMKDRTIYESLHDIAFDHEGISGFFKYNHNETLIHKRKIKEFESKQNADTQF